MEEWLFLDINSPTFKPLYAVAVPESSTSAQSGRVTKIWRGWNHTVVNGQPVEVHSVDEIDPLTGKLMQNVPYYFDELGNPLDRRIEFDLPTHQQINAEKGWRRILMEWAGMKGAIAIFVGLGGLFYTFLLLLDRVWHRRWLKWREQNNLDALA